MQSVSKSKLKANMLRFFREIEASGEEMIVTDRGRPVLRILPIKHRLTVDELFGEMRGAVEYPEDPDTPTIDEWPVT